MEWERSSLTRTYRLNHSTVDRLNRLVAQTGAWHSEVVEMLLTTALYEVEMGHWVIRTRPGRPIVDGVEVR